MLMQHIKMKKKNKQLHFISSFSIGLSLSLSLTTKQRKSKQHITLNTIASKKTNSQRMQFIFFFSSFTSFTWSIKHSIILINIYQIQLYRSQNWQTNKFITNRKMLYFCMHANKPNTKKNKTHSFFTYFISLLFFYLYFKSSKYINKRMHAKLNIKMCQRQNKTTKQLYKTKL